MLTSQDVLDRLPDGVKVEAVWPTPPDAVREEVEAFWRRHGALGDGAEVQQRSRELCLVARSGGEVIGVTTAVLRRVEQVRCRLYALRVFVSPEARRSGLALGLTIMARDALEEHSRWNSEESGLGMVVVIQSPALWEKIREPYWERTGLHLMGFDRFGNQIRVHWFKHAKLPEELG